MVKYLFILFLISSCSSYDNTKSSLPSWYVNPTQNDSANLYGVGEGFTIQEASKSALNNLSSKLAVSVSSSSSTLSAENKYSFSEEFREKINQRVQEVTFNNYVISNSQRDGAKFYSEVLVNRAEFISSQKSLLKNKHKIMKNLYDSSRNKNILIRRNKLAKTKDMIPGASLINQILKGLRVNLDFEKNSDQYQFYQDAYDKILDKVEFFIKSDNLKIKDVVIKALNDKNLKVVNLKKNNSKDLVIIDIKNSSNSVNIYGSNITNIKVKFKLLSNKNNILASNIVQVSGASVGDGNSFSAAINNFAKQIEKEGILQIIGADQK